MVVHEYEIDPDDLDRPNWNSLLNNYSKHDIGEAYFQGRVEQIGLDVEHWGIDKRHQDDHLIFDNKMDLRLWEPLDGQNAPPDEWPGNEFDRRVFTTEVAGPTVPSLAISGEDPQPEPIDEEVSWELRGIVDVKTKSNEDWLGKFNLRHLAHYAEWANFFDVPVFIYMTMVDTEEQSVGETDFLTPVPGVWEWESLVDNYNGVGEMTYGELKDAARTCPIVDRTFRAPDGNLVVEIEDWHRRNWDWFTAGVL